MGFDPVTIGVLTAATAGSIYQGVSGAKGQRKALRQQEQAQQEAQADAARQARSSEEAINAANQKAPDVAGILADEQRLSSRGSSSTLLTGQSGVDRQMLNLRRRTLLGE